MLKPDAPRVDRSPSATAVFALGAAATLATSVGLHVGAGRSVTLAAVGTLALAAVVTALQVPLLGLVGVTVVTVGNISDILIRYWGAPSINLLLIPGLALILAYRWIARGERPFLHGGTLAAIGAFLALLLSGSLYARDHEAALVAFDEALRNMIIVVFMLCFMSYKNSLRAMFDAILALAAVSVAVALYKYGISGDLANEFRGFARIPRYGGDRLAGFMADPNEYGAILVLMLPLAVHRAFWSDSLVMRGVAVAVAGGILASIMLTSSRGALVALFFGGLLFMLTLERKLAIRFMAAGAVAAVVALGMLSEELIARFSTIIAVAETGQATDPAVSGRLGAWAVAVRLFYDNPVLGVGPGNFNVLYQTTANDLGIIFGGRDLSPHGLYTEIASEHGVVGLLVFMTVIASAGRGVLRAMAMLRARGDRKAEAMCAAFGVSLASYLAAMVFLHGSGARLLWMMLAVGLALPGIVRHRLDGRSYGSASAPGGSAPL
jgi:O-antigen ligase